jgi:tetratricopeptide (TPR) repeat protein
VVAFEIPDSIECREVTTPQFAKANPTEKVIEAKFRISAIIKAGEEKQIAWVLYQLGHDDCTKNDKSIRIIDFLPNTKLESTHDGGSIEVQENSSTAIHADSSANGSTTVGYATTQASIHGQFDSNQATTKRYKAIAPKSLVLASGTAERGRSVFFKLKPSLQSSLEGEKEFAFLAVVPRRWRGDVLTIYCRAIWENKGLLSTSFDHCGFKAAYIGLYLDQDDEAKQLAKKLSEPGEAIFERIAAVAPTAVSIWEKTISGGTTLTKDEMNRRIFADESVKPVMKRLEEIDNLLGPLAYGYLCRGYLEAAMGKYDQVIADFNKAVRLDPNDAGFKQRVPTRNTATERKQSRTLLMLVNLPNKKTVASLTRSQPHTRNAATLRRPRNRRRKPSNWRKTIRRQRRSLRLAYLFVICFT